MATPFERTLRTLNADRFRVTGIGVAVASVFVVAWLAWLFLARVTLRELSSSARIEIERRPTPVDSAADGMLVSIDVEPGDRVKAGTPLVHLQATREQHAVDEHEAALRGVIAEIASMRAESRTAEQSLASERRGIETAIARARAEAQEKSAPATLARAESLRLEQLAKQGLVSPSEVERGQSEEVLRRSAAVAATASLATVEQDLKTKLLGRQARIDELASGLARAEGRKASLESTLAASRFERDRRIIRAPLDGVIAELATLKPGEFVEEGESLAVIVPESRQLQVVALFPPAAIGRVRAGQTARVRLDAYPSAEYGAVPATVRRIAGEVRDGHVRVELTIAGFAEARMPVEHGMPGSAEIDVERISPASLLLRIAGGWLARAPQ
jgi:membrane fusion protein (multidrug efflux system)